MIDLKKYCVILFMTGILSITKLKQFTESHIARLAENNPGGIYSTILAAMTTKYNALYGSSSNETLQLAIQVALTSGMNSSHDTLLNYIRRREGTIKGAWDGGVHSVEYIECFPRGLTPFDKAPLMEFGTLGDNFLSFVTTHSADLPAGIVTETTGLLNTYKDNRTLQLSKIGSVKGIHTGTFVAKEDVCKQLSYDLLTIARDILGHPEQLSTYFDLGLIPNNDNDALRGKVPPSATANLVDEGLTALSTFHYKNNGNARLFVSRSANAYTAGALGVWLEPGQEGNGGVAELGTGPFFNVTNGNATLEGNYSVTQTL